MKGANLEGAKLNHTNLLNADLSFANLKFALLKDSLLYGTNLYHADLKSADLCGAHFNELPLSWNSTHVHIDDNQATQLLYYLLFNVMYSKNTSIELKTLLGNENLIAQAKKFCSEFYHE